MAARDRKAKRIEEEPDDEDKAILQEAKDRFKRDYDWEVQFRALYVQDVKFANGDSDNGWQWPEDLRRDRETNKRPALTINKTQRHVALITNDARQNKPSISIKPTGNESSFESSQIYEGLVRDIEYKSHAQDIYDDATDSQVEGGIGYWRVEQYYPDDDSFDQSLRISPVRNHLAVLLDCDIKQKDGSDAEHGFIFDEMPRKEFERQFPDIDERSIAANTAFTEGDDWVRQDYIRIAEYYRIKKTEDELYWVEAADGQSSTFLASDAPKGFKDELVDGKYRKRKVTRKQLEWFKIAGNAIIARRTEKENPLKGQFIPIARVVGIEKVIDGRLERKGFVRALKDPQRMYNYNALQIDTPIPTPAGWTTIDKIMAGDIVLNDTGKPTTVLGVSPIFINRPCFKVTFDNGTSIVADNEHLWTVEERGKRKSATWEWSTKTIKTGDLTPKKHFIWATKPLDLPAADLPLKPYVLGAWLGDGSSNGGVIHSGLNDMLDMRKNLMACGYHVSEPRLYGNKAAAELRIFGIRKYLSSLHVLGNKHIPPQYLRSSHAQREALLQGLMDTDGHITKSGQCIFITTSDAICAGFAELLNGLGIKAVYEKMAGAVRKFPNGRSYECQPHYRFQFSANDDVTVFWLARKDLRQDKAKYHQRRTKRHRIISVEPIASVPTKCITVDTPSKLFLAGEGMVPTHNSSGQVEFGALQSKTPWVGAAAAFEGNEVAWNNANRNNAAYLTFKHLDGEGEVLPPQALPQRIDPPTSAPAMLQGMQIAASEMEMVSGQYQAQMGQPSNERSGKAIAERQRQSDVATYLFVNNLAIAIRYTGRIIIDLVPHIYDTKRVLQILGKDGVQSKVTLDPEAENAYTSTTEQGVDKVLFNPLVGKYEVQADVGPAYATQRQEAWNAFVQIVTGAPALIDEIGDLMFRSADFPLADKIAERLRRKIETNAPYLLRDGAANPQLEQLKQALQQAQGQVGELIQKLAEKNLELKDKEAEQGTRQYEAESHRLTAETNSIVDLKKSQIELHELMVTITQTLDEMRNSGTANGGQPTGEAKDNGADDRDTDGQDPLVEQNEIPPVEGAQKGKDGNWYLNRDGQNFAVMPHGNA